MKKEQLRMQMIAGIITEDQYKAKLSENDNGSGVSLKEGGNIMTAVEWLVEELKSRSINLNKWNSDLVEQAKEMEKQQLIDAYSVGHTSDFKVNSDNKTQTPEQYYNETFTK